MSIFPAVLNLGSEWRYQILNSITDLGLEKEFGSQL